MAAITNKAALPAPTSAWAVKLVRGLIILAMGAGVWYFGRENLWFFGFVLVAVFELASPVLDRARLWARVPHLITGASAVLIIMMLPKALSQLTVAALYVVWRTWQDRMTTRAASVFINLLIVQAIAFEALFLGAAVNRWPAALVIILSWIVAFLPVYRILGVRGERAAGVLAAAWALVVAELTWLFMTWLVSYIVEDNYLIVPQPALILTTLAYCFGNIYYAQRQGKLNRARLTEYLFIGIILLALVITGTRWRGNV